MSQLSHFGYLVNSMCTTSANVGAITMRKAIYLPSTSMMEIEYGAKVWEKF